MADDDCDVQVDRSWSMSLTLVDPTHEQGKNLAELDGGLGPRGHALA